MPTKDHAPSAMLDAAAPAKDGVAAASTRITARHDSGKSSYGRSGAASHERLGKPPRANDMSDEPSDEELMAEAQYQDDMRRAEEELYARQVQEEFDQKAAADFEAQHHLDQEHQ
jgi:hypothetical protein